MYITRLWGIGLLLLSIVYHKLEKRPSNADAHKKFPGEGGTKKGVAGRRNIRYNRETTKKAVEHVELLKQRIRQDGTVKGTDVLKVDSFLNHQMDIDLFEEIGKEFKRRFEGCGVNKILTIEASGIGIACIAAQHFHCPVVFAKKSQSKNIAGAVYATRVESFTHGRVYDVIVSRKFLGPGDRVLIIDDFLANGAALEGLTDLVSQSGAQLAGAGIVIEKAFQPGGDRLRAKGIRVESLARVKSMSETGGVEFTD